ncbi:Wzz/FepE/Etk N-terminal domain-containing protein [Paenibacillus taichungensis]|uniref:YveK family protein n=1 Tax=Paenibacillus TaxID=44249 RepID=UPI00096EA501|nr:Wzz/FepE/Etk N-terminal domain-containing protein [Paenibacillus taichungensis]MEC0106644.1 Wzz/FepE/Etk N-terminal domain-containing protein [Paenibacillus taichungensis]MEC0198570.1 Wzz/FepE/Etk N-terminal domain-containing protein [Paenibacillus taichungensis]OME77815.1 lipopolysaccharide biosynthesis protein [Paenibacillus pabuli]
MELKEYMQILRKRIWIIVAFVAVACIGAGVKNYFFTVPVYEASSKIIVNQAYNAQGVPNLDYASIQTNIKVINSYMEIIKSSAILDKVATTYPDLGLTGKALGERIKVSTANESQVMNLTAIGVSPEKAAKTVNAVTKIFKSQIPVIMKVDNITILSEANPNDNTKPVNYNPLMNVLISFIVGLLLAIGLVFLLEYLDDTLKTEDEIERELGIPALAVISRVKKDDARSSKQTILSQQQVGENQYATINQ